MGIIMDTVIENDARTFLIRSTAYGYEYNNFKEYKEIIKFFDHKIENGKCYIKFYDIAEILNFINKIDSNVIIFYDDGPFGICHNEWVMEIYDDYRE